MTALVVPATTGAGAAVAVNGEGVARTLVYSGGAGDDRIELQGSINGVDFAEVWTVNGASQTHTFDDRCTSYRAFRRAGSSGAAPSFEIAAGAGTTAPAGLYVQLLITDVFPLPLPLVQFHRAVAAQTITLIRIAPFAAYAVSDVDWDLIEVVITDPNGGSEVVAGSILTKATGGTGSWTPLTDIDVPIASAAVAAGFRLHLRLSIAGGAGKPLPPCALYLVLSQP